MSCTAPLFERFLAFLDVQRHVDEVYLQPPLHPAANGAGKRFAALFRDVERFRPAGLFPFRVAKWGKVG
ncbi:MAG: hypothetical protein ACXWES_05730 [Solirubrobacterales bacterium]